MTEIVPAIMPQGLEDLKYEASEVKNKVKTVQLDLMDGIFVPERTWPFPNLKNISKELGKEGLPFWKDLNFELDLMVKNAASKIEDLILLGPSRLIFHIEAEDNLDIAKIRERVGSIIEIGLAINTTTPIEKIEPFISETEGTRGIDFVQCMGIAEIGFQGQPHDPRVFDHINYLRKKYPKLIISVDGAVNIKNAKKFAEAGVNRLVVGSAIFESDDINKTIAEFHSILEG